MYKKRFVYKWAATIYIIIVCHSHVPNFLLLFVSVQQFVYTIRASGSNFSSQCEGQSQSTINGYI